MGEDRAAKRATWKDRMHVDRSVVLGTAGQRDWPDQLRTERRGEMWCRKVRVSLSRYDTEMNKRMNNLPNASYDLMFVCNVYLFK